MAFSSYGGLVWSGEQAEPYNPDSSAGLKLGVAAGAGVGLFYGATRDMGDGKRLLDYAAEAGRTVGNLSPFQLLNTFRGPDWAFPFLSPGQQGLEDGTYTWGKEFLEDRSSFDYIQAVTGKDDTALRKAGLTPRMKGIPGELATDLVYKSGEGARGSLYTRMGGELNLLSDSVSLMGRSPEIDPFTRKTSSIGQAIKGVMGAMGLYDTEGFVGEQVLRKKILTPGDAAKYERAPVLPVPSVTGQVDSLADVGRRTALARGVSAFEIGRFNQLVDGYFPQFFGETLGRPLARAATVRPGTASAMLARYGVKAGGAAGLAIGVAQTDWMRREFSIPGQILGSGFVSGALGYGALKLGGAKAGMMTAVGSFFGQMVLPGFDQGVIQGIATTGTKLEGFRASDLNPFGYYRRTLEGFLPGVSNWETGALVGIGAMLGSGARIPFTGKRLSEHIFSGLGSEVPGFKEHYQGRKTGVPSSTRDIFWSRMQQVTPGTEDINPVRFGGRLQIAMGAWGEQGGFMGFFKEANKQWAQAEEDFVQRSRVNPQTTALLESLDKTASKYKGGNWLQRLGMEAEGFGKQVYYSFFGADGAYNKEIREKISALGFKGPTGKLGRYGSLFAGAMAGWSLLTGGALGSMESKDELQDIYAGRKLVEVKKSRWWEGGGTPFEGGNTTYFRPHQYHLMMNRVREKGIWGDREDSTSPIAKFLIKNFTYDLERQNYYSRPYPVTSAAFQDVPIIGGALAATIGQLVKPTKIMHAQEWIRPTEGGDLEFASVFEGSRREPSYALGAVGPGTPTSPLSPGQQLSFLSYQARELSGLSGWARNVIQQSITGEDVWGTDSSVLADASLISSPRVRFWEMQMGGLFFSNELWRRVFPRYRSEFEKTNPISNNMPSWLPDKFRMSDPYRSVEWGEARLPGAGFAALHPELKGVDPQAYPAIYRYQILADVAPHSKEFRMTRDLVYQKRMAGSYTEQAAARIDRIDSQVAKVINAKEFDRVDDRAIQLPGSGATQSLWFGGQSLLRHAAAPAEYMVPMGFRPVQKLMGNRDMVEQYEYERMYGTPLAFWDKPIRDWFRPAMYSAAHMVGFSGKPMWRREADKANEYFDKLEFQKWMMLADKAGEAGDSREKSRYLWAASQTRFGVNPQGSPMSIYWSLPAEERQFFNAFSHAQGAERERILEMVPSDQVHLYRAVWSRMDSGDPTLWGGEKGGVDEAFLRDQYLGLTNSGYGPQPPADWIGYNEDVDMDDIRVRYVDRLGADLHDYGLWESQLKKSSRQPFLEGSVDYIPRNLSASNTGQVQSSLHNMSGVHGNRGGFSVFSGGSSSSAVIDFNDNRDADIAMMANRMINGY